MQYHKFSTSNSYQIRKRPPETSKWWKKVTQSQSARKIESLIEKNLNKIDPQINVRRLELYYGILETFNTAGLAVRLYTDPNSKFTYKEMMSIDRFKRESVKLLFVFSPFMVIPFSFIWYFPVLVSLAYFFPKFIMPAQYMRGRNSRAYYGAIHDFRKKSHPYAVWYLEQMRNKYVTPPVLSTILDDVHNGKILDVHDLKLLQDYLKREDRLHLSNIDPELVKTYNKSLLRWTFAVPIFSERNLKKRLQAIIELDTVLRQPGALDKLDPGELREAVFIRGCNGYEPHRTTEANKYWLRNWLEMTGHIDRIYFRYREEEMAYVALLSVLWSMNFTQGNFDRHF